MAAFSFCQSGRAVSQDAPSSRPHPLSGPGEHDADCAACHFLQRIDQRAVSVRRHGLQNLQKRRDSKHDAENKNCASRIGEAEEGTE
jgi:hypothetical protein